MILSEFIRQNHLAIVNEWESFAGSLLPAAGGMGAVRLRDHAEDILAAIVLDLEAPQGAAEQRAKSKGHGQEHRMEAVGKAHAALRIEDGFKLGQLVGEYRALRASVLHLFERAAGKGDGCDLQQITRFNEALDEALVEATNRYMVVMNRTSDQFLAVLGHDLRNPLGAIMMSAEVISRHASAEDAKAAALILTSAGRMNRMVNDLLDLTRTRLGSGIPIAPSPMDLGPLCRDTLAELQAFHPESRLQFSSTGDLKGTWDLDRLAQVLSNLVGNALQHGQRNGLIEVIGKGEGDEILIEVQNQGNQIPPALLANIFEPMVRKANGSEDKGSTSLGLGLHIAREIVLAHGGTVHVESTPARTTFGVRLPRHSTAVSPGAKPVKETDQHDAEGGIVVADLAATAN